MTHKSWTLSLNQQKHTIELDHGYISGSREIRVDGRMLELPPEERQMKVDFGSRHHFLLGGHDVAVVIRTNGVTFSYDLEVDGISSKTGQPGDQNSPDFASAVSAASRVVNAAFLALLGMGGFWWNTHMAHTRGMYWPALAMISPVALGFALLLWLYGEKLQQPVNKVPLGAWVLVAVALLLGLLNWYALENGLY